MKAIYIDKDNQIIEAEFFDDLVQWKIKNTKRAVVETKKNFLLRVQKNKWIKQQLNK
jgi:hypothetical protein